MIETPSSSQGNLPSSSQKHGIRRALFTLLIVILLVLLSAGMIFRDKLAVFGLAPVPQGNPSKTNQPLSVSISPLNDQQAVLLSITTNQPGDITPVNNLSPTSPASAASFNQSMTYSPSGTMILSLADGNISHLFAYQPLKTPLTRLTSGAWDDITPAASPDGKRIAFASNRGGHWDIYILNLTDGQVTQFTNTPDYDGTPTWSPDGRWLAYESYVSDKTTGQGNLKIYIRDIMAANATSQPSIQLTDSPGADYSPAWSPSGRQVAFVSNRNDSEEIWLADLDHIEQLHNISHNAPVVNGHPSWSPDGKMLAWSSVINGIHTIYAWDAVHPERPPYPVGNGDWPAWSPDGKILATGLETPNRTYLTAYGVQNRALLLPAIDLNSPLDGLTWTATDLPNPLPPALAQVAQITPASLWTRAVDPLANNSIGRQHLAPLSNVSAPYPQLNNMVNESFTGLQAAVSQNTGWDYLSTLENAFVPLTTPLFPGEHEDWLYTGRGVALNTAPLNAGWLVVTRQDFGTETYWRLFLRARSQDGSQGMPLRQEPWDFNARNSGDQLAYEQGGKLISPPPSGYWIDITRLATIYGWERMPALPSWRLALPGARYNEYVLSDGLSWYAAMLEIYPPEALYTSTPLPPPTLTPTVTPFPSRTPTPTITPLYNATPSISSEISATITLTPTLKVP